MMRMLQSCIAKGVLRINPRFEEVIIALSAQNKGDNPYSMNIDMRNVLLVFQAPLVVNVTATWSRLETSSNVFFYRTLS
ncbi:MAG: hypothetical protein WA461_09190 [Nitrososphaeraceae archaeon]